MQPPEVRRALGLADLGRPAATTLHDAFKRLDTAGFESVLQAWASEALRRADWQLVLEGKALRGLYGEELPGVRVVAVYASEAGLVSAQAGGRTGAEQAGTDEAGERAKRKAEPGAVLRLLAQVRPVSGDALYCQKVLCRPIRWTDGDDLFAVKVNQPDLLDAVALLFREPSPGERFPTPRTVDKPGGRLEQQLQGASAALAGYGHEAA